MARHVVEILGRSEQGRTHPFLYRCDDDELYYVKGHDAGRRSLVPCHGYLVAFRTPVRTKHKARDSDMVVLMAKERNAVIGAYRRSHQNILWGEPARARGLRCVA